MKRMALAVVTVCLVGVAQGVYTTFDFETGLTTDDATISAYMSGVYGSDVVVDDGAIVNNASLVAEAWAGNDSKFLRQNHAYSADMAILFTEPIRSLSGDTRGYVFWESGTYDFRIKALGAGWDTDGGTLESPNYDFLVADQWIILDDVDVGGVEVDIEQMVFPEPVYLLELMDFQAYAIAIDDLTVEPWREPPPPPPPLPPVPAPAAVVLGGLGACLVGWLRGRRTL